MATSDGLFIKDQMEMLFKAWGCTEPLPKPSQQVLICFPPAFDVRLIRITRTQLTSTYGKPLWRAEYDPPITLPDVQVT